MSKQFQDQFSGPILSNLTLSIFCESFFLSFRIKQFNSTSTSNQPNTLHLAVKWNNHYSFLAIISLIVCLWAKSTHYLLSTQATKYFPYSTNHNPPSITQSQSTFYHPITVHLLSPNHSPPSITQSQSTFSHPTIFHRSLHKVFTPCCEWGFGAESSFCATRSSWTWFLRQYISVSNFIWSHFSSPQTSSRRRLLRHVRGRKRK